MNFKKLIASITAFGLLTTFTGCQLISKTPEAIKKTAVATVDSREISKGDYDLLYNAQLMQYKMMYPAETFQDANTMKQFKSMILSQTINTDIIFANAKAKNIYPSDKLINDEVKTNYDKTIKSAGTEQKLKDKLTENNLTLEDYKSYLKTDSINRNILDTLKKQQKITDKEITTYYYANQFNYTTKQNTMNVSHILVKTTAEANKIEAMLKKGDKFETLAKKYSTDPGSKDKGGLLGDIEYNKKDFDPTFLTAGIATKVGNITPPIKSSYGYGYYIIRVNSKKEYPFKKLETVKSEIKSTIETSKVEAIVKDWISKAKITKYEDRL